MYYGEFARITRLERLLERLAYISVGLDFFVAAATYLVMRGAAFSSQMLVWSGYLMFAEVILAACILILLTALKHYGKIIESIATTAFRNRYGNIGVVGKRSLLARLVLRVFSASRN